MQTKYIPFYNIPTCFRNLAYNFKKDGKVEGFAKKHIYLEKGIERHSSWYWAANLIPGTQPIIALIDSYSKRKLTKEREETAQKMANDPQALTLNLLGNEFAGDVNIANLILNLQRMQQLKPEEQDAVKKELEVYAPSKAADGMAVMLNKQLSRSQPPDDYSLLVLLAHTFFGKDGVYHLFTDKELDKLLDGKENLAAALKKPPPSLNESDFTLPFDWLQEPED